MTVTKWNTLLPAAQSQQFKALLPLARKYLSVAWSQDVIAWASLWASPCRKRG